MFGLARENLIDGVFLYGTAEEIRSQYPNAKTLGIVFTPSVLGAELYLWAHGRGDVEIHRLFNKALQLTSGVTIKTTSGCCSVTYPDRSIPAGGPGFRIP